MKKRWNTKLLPLLGAIIVISLICNGFSKKETGIGSTYYVNPQGTETGTGTKSDPFPTIQEGIDHLKPGDTLLIGNGLYCENVTISKRGTKEKPITIKSEENHQAVLSGKNSESPILMTIENSRYLDIEGLCFQDACGNDSCGILVENKSSNIRIHNNLIRRIKATLPIAQDHSANAILIFGENEDQPISNIKITQNQVVNCQTGWAEAISVTGNVTYVVIQANTVKNNGNIGIDLSGNYGYCKNKAVDFPRHCKVIDNQVSGCSSSYATAYGIYVDGGQDIIIRNNKVSECQGGIEIGAENWAPLKYATSHITVSGNRMENNLENGLTIGGYEDSLGWVTDVNIKNNTCLNNGLDNVILTLAKCKKIKISNNTFQNKMGEAYIVYNKFKAKYTNQITFLHNKYGNEQKASDTSFMYHGKEITDFSVWQRITKDNKSSYGR